MATALTLTSLQTQLVQAQRQVARDLAQVDADQSQLDQSQRQLARDQRALDGVYDRRRELIGPPSAPQIDNPAPRTEPAVAAAPLRGSISSEGQPLGRLINVAA